MVSSVHGPAGRRGGQRWVSSRTTFHKHTLSGGVAKPFPHQTNAAPVVEVHDGLDGAAATGVDVALEARQQRRHHVHPVPLALPETNGDHE